MAVNNVKILYTNARSLTSGTRREEIELLIKRENIDIVGITETWGKLDITDSEMSFTDYKLYRKDRASINDRKGGGVALYVKNSFQSVEWEELNSRPCESVWCKVYVDKNDYILAGVCYRSPEADDCEINELFHTIKLACDTNQPVLIMGDFNYPNINWMSLEADNKGQKFVKLVLDCYLEQHVHKPTRNENILDLILSSELPIKDDIRVLPPVDKSDHNVLICNFECRAEHKKSKKKLCYNQANYEDMRTFIKSKLENVNYTAMSAFAIWNYLSEVLQVAVKKFVPERMVTCKQNKPLWMTSHVLKNVKKKHHLWKKWRARKDDKTELLYKKQANLASKAVRLAKRNFERKIAQNIKSDSKSFFTYVRSKTRVRSTVGPLLNNNGILVNENQGMSELLNAFFASVFTSEKKDYLPTIKNVFCGVNSQKLCTFNITSDMVKMKLSKLKMNKAPGIDQIGTRMLIEIAEEISDTVTELFNKSLHLGEIPQDWKLANVTPVFKKGKKTDPSNYRPVSLTVILCKVFESIMRDKMLDHLVRYELIKETQHGFVKKKSCLTNLLVFLEELTKYLDSGYPVDVIYLDFQKAFDKVPHQRLITKLAAHGFDGDILNWIENWLADRKQRVVINGQFSGWRDVLSGVPQGSVLGPLLFVIYINDIDESVVSRALKFADDTKIYHTVNTSSDIEMLRSDLCNLFSWSTEWQMLFNVEKCHVMHLGYGNPRVDYIMDGKRLETVTEEKDLGVFVSEDLKWEKQCSYAVSKANKVLGMIKRNFVDRSKEIIIPLYKSLVRPHLEYCSQIWNPHFNKDVKLIEGVQRRATKLVQGMEHLSYDSRLKELGLMRLSSRRIRSDLIETFKITSGMYNISKDEFFEFDDGGRRGHSKKLLKKRCRLDVRKYTFSNRVVDKWNSLPDSSVNCTSVIMFKMHIASQLEPETQYLCLRIGVIWS